MVWPFQKGPDGLGGTLIVLMYHAIADRQDADQLAVPEGLFRAQMGWLRELGWRVARLDEAARALRAGTLEAPAVAITFDDGYLSTYIRAFPVLQEFGYPATVFLVGGVVGSDGAAFMPREFGPPLQWEHAREMLRHGIAFGSHSMTHRKLSRLPPAEARREISDSKRLIEDRLSAGIGDFAYPYGAYDAFTPETDRIAREEGFETLSTTLAGHNRRPEHVLRLRRLRISWAEGSRRELEKQCRGCYNWYALYQRLTG